MNGVGCFTFFFRFPIIYSTIPSKHQTTVIAIEIIFPRKEKLLLLAEAVAAGIEPCIFRQLRWGYARMAR
jgi:hypothetical protein